MKDYLNWKNNYYVSILLSSSNIIVDDNGVDPCLFSRNVLANTFAPNTGIGDLVINSGRGKRIHFKTGETTIVPALTVTTSNIGIGTTVPTSNFHIHRGTVQDVRMQLTDSGTGTGITDGLIIRKDTAQNGYLWNHEASAGLIFGTNNAERLRINQDGNVGISTNNPTTAKLVIHGTSGAIGLDMASSDQYAEMRVIRNSLSSLDKHLYLNLGSGSTAAEVKIYSNNTEIFKVGNTGVSFANNYWHSSLEGSGRLYFESASTTYIKGHGGTPFVFRNGADTNIATISSAGNVTIAGTLNVGGTLTLPQDTNAISSGGGARTYYVNNGVSIYWGRGTGSQHEFRGSANTNLLTINNDGKITTAGTINNATISGGNLSGTMYREAPFLYHLYRDSHWGSGAKFLIQTNLIFNSYDRPQLQYRWMIGVSSGDSLGWVWGFFCVIYDQSRNGFSAQAISGGGGISISQNWGSQGENRLNIDVNIANAPNYINLNIY